MPFNRPVYSQPALIQVFLRKGMTILCQCPKAFKEFGGKMIQKSIARSYDLFLTGLEINLEYGVMNMSGYVFGITLKF